MLHVENLCPCIGNVAESFIEQHAGDADSDADDDVVDDDKFDDHFGGYVDGDAAADDDADDGYGYSDFNHIVALLVIAQTHDWVEHTILGLSRSVRQNICGHEVFY